MPHLTVAILAGNSEKDIGECLESVSWADERIVILDTRSQDRTAVIAQEMGARVVPHKFEDFARQREFGLSLPQGEWLFYVDSDERATPALAAEIRRVIAEKEHVGWWVPRRNFIWGKEIRHGGWYPDYQLRLLKLGHAHYDLARPVHEVVILDGSAGYLKEPLLHYNYRSLSEFLHKQRQYISYEAAILLEKGIRPKPWTFFTQPAREFWRRYVRLQGYKDGAHGFLLCSLVAYYYGFRVSVELARLWAQKR
ncbi:MAG: glycosyltransferase family 2 protein [Anaerolineae bacterium]|nr:glycosyltransferase family 2 protein [Anaerolineae bacterium]